MILIQVHTLRVKSKTALQTIWGIKTNTSLFSVPTYSRLTCRAPWPTKFTGWLVLEAGQLFILLLMECYWHLFNETTLMSVDSSDSTALHQLTSTRFSSQIIQRAESALNWSKQEMITTRRGGVPVNRVPLLFPVSVTCHYEELYRVILRVNDHTWKSNCLSTISTI